MQYWRAQAGTKLFGRKTRTSPPAAPSNVVVASLVDLFRQLIERRFNQGDLSVGDEICSNFQPLHFNKKQMADLPVH